jgi:hypothetical protein
MAAATHARASIVLKSFKGFVGFTPLFAHIFLFHRCTNFSPMFQLHQQTRQPQTDVSGRCGL